MNLKENDCVQIRRGRYTGFLGKINWVDSNADRCGIYIPLKSYMPHMPGISIVMKKSTVKKINKMSEVGILKNNAELKPKTFKAPPRPTGRDENGRFICNKKKND